MNHLYEELKRFIIKYENTTEENVKRIYDYQCERLFQDYIEEHDNEKYVEIKNINKMQRMKNEIFTDEIKKIANEFKKNKLMIVNLKGISLLKDLYGDNLEAYKKRKINDIDVLISFKDMGKSLDLLGNLGYYVISTNEKVSARIVDKYIDTVNERGIHFPEFGKEINCEGSIKYIKMDCHISLMHTSFNKKIEMDTIIRRSEMLFIDGIPVHILELHDRLLHLIMHFTKEVLRCDVRWYLTGERIFDCNRRLRLPLLYEIALLIDKYRESINWELLLDRANNLFCQDEVNLALSLLKKLFPDLIESRLINYIKINKTEKIIQYKYKGMFYALDFVINNDIDLLEYSIERIAKEIMMKSLSKEKLQLKREYYIANIDEENLIHGQGIYAYSNEILGKIKFFIEEDNFIFQIESELLIQHCTGFDFTIGLLKKSTVINAFINKFHVDFEKKNFFGCAECCISNFYIDFKLKNTVFIDKGKSIVLVKLPLNLLGIEKNIKYLFFDIGISELAFKCDAQYHIQKYNINDIGNRGLSNVFHCSPKLLYTIKLF